MMQQEREQRDVVLVIPFFLIEEVVNVSGQQHRAGLAGIEHPAGGLEKRGGLLAHASGRVWLSGAMRG